VAPTGIAARAVAHCDRRQFLIAAGIAAGASGSLLAPVPARAEAGEGWELAVKQVLEIMSDALATGERIEIRGFGSFSLHFRPPRQGRNPKTGEAVALSGKHVPHFKPGKDLRERVNEGAGRPIRD